MPILAIAQPPDSLWSRTYGGTSGELCYSVQETSDGGYILAGSTRSFGAGLDDFWLVKTDANGDSLWSRTFGGDRSETCHSVQQTTDGGYILAGNSMSFGPGWLSYWLVKTDANGDSLWSRAYGGDGFQTCYSVHQTSDGGYILAGKSDSFGSDVWDIWLLKTDSNGDSIWNRVFGSDGNDECYSAQQTSDGGYVLAGAIYSFEFESFDSWLIKTDADGNCLWNRTYGGIDGESCNSVQQTSDGGYILAGTTSSFGAGWRDFWLLKTDADGDSLWSRTFGGSDLDWCNSVRQTSDGGYILAGQSIGSLGFFDFWVVRTDAHGDSLWGRSFGGDSTDVCQSVQQTSDGGYVLAGWTNSFGAGGADFWLVKTGPELAAERYEVSLPEEYTLHQNWPNPFNPSTQISYDLPKMDHVMLTVYDLLGREVRMLANGANAAGNHTLVFDGYSLPAGIYFYRLQVGSFAVAKKMVLLK
ncbi:MAG: T9SS type A sorting domain-containing protein [bacterium]